MKNRYLACIVVIVIIAFALIFENNNSAMAYSDVCGDAADQGVCIGEGAKCNIKKGWLTFRCGKDPDGGSIIIEKEEK